MTENQLAALEHAGEEKEVHGEIKTYHPGCLGAQDTYYVGNIKGVWHIYQQTLIDTYTKTAFCKVCDRKNVLVAADTFSVIPFSIHKKYPCFAENIDHSRTKAKPPQTNGICERFNKTCKDEFYSAAFRRKLPRIIEEIQLDLDQG